MPCWVPHQQCVGSCGTMTSSSSVPLPLTQSILITVLHASFKGDLLVGNSCLTHNMGCSTQFLAFSMTQGVQRKDARVALTELPRGLVPKACLHFCLMLHTPLHASRTSNLKARPVLEWSCTPCSRSCPGFWVAETPCTRFFFIFLFCILF